MPDLDPDLLRLARRQRGAVHRDQLRAIGLTRSQVAHQLRSGRWTAVGQQVVVLGAGLGLPLGDRRQLMWTALLDAGPQSALASHTSLELARFRTFATEAADLHLLVQRGARVTPLPGVVVHESRRFDAADTSATGGLRRTRTARSAVDAAAWQPWPRFACALLAAVVQQRLCTAAQLDQCLAEVGRVRHKQYMRLAVADIAGGAESMGELDVATMCRRFGLQPPDRQVPRRDRLGGWRFTDCEWKTSSGSTVVLEVDGSHHLDPAHWGADMVRERTLVISGTRVLRATTFELRLDAGAVAADLRAAGVPVLADLSGAEHALAS